MSTVRTHIVMPAKLAKDIDELVGPRGRSAFLVANAEREVKRRKLLALLESAEPIWKDEDHPEIVGVGTATWVHNLRREQSARQEHLDKLAEENLASDVEAG
jgi:hypothetical protein